VQGITWKEAKLSLSLALVVLFSSPAMSEDTPDTEPEPKPVEVFVSEVTLEQVADSVVFGGIVEAGADYVVFSEQVGVVEKVAVAHGQPVEKGELLFVIRPQGSGMSYRHYRISSPVNGEVGIVDTRVGQLVEVGGVLTKVAEVGARLVDIEVTTADLRFLKAGQTCNASSFVGRESKDTQQKPELPCVVESISKRARPETGTFPVRVAISCQGVHRELCQGSFLPGSFTRVSFRNNQREVILVNQTHLNRQRTKAFILLEDNSIKEVAVKLGQQFRGRIEVLEGLEVGHRLVTHYNRAPQDGDIAVIVDPDAPIVSEGEGSQEDSKKSG